MIDRPHARHLASHAVQHNVNLAVHGLEPIRECVRIASRQISGPAKTYQIGALQWAEAVSRERQSLNSDTIVKTGHLRLRK